MKKFFNKNKIVIILATIVLVYFSYIYIKQELKHDELTNDKIYYANEIDRLKVEIEELNKKIDEISTPEYIEKIARERLKMVKPDEIIYIIDEQD